nr:outer membrane lipoprotein LolB [Schlegelella koreensis]
MLGALLLAGCALTPQPFAPGGDALTGRLALRIEASGTQPARAFAAAFDLRGSADAGGLDLSTPLGSLLAQARWQPGEVALRTPQGSRRYADLDALSRDVLGEPVPLAALFDWLRGRPWPGAPSAPGPDGGFEQLGWRVDLSRLADAAVSAVHPEPPVMSVRVQLDRP